MMSKPRFRVPRSAFRVRRPGLSLTEVLVALFIMALGTIAILTMFPLGAFNIAQALKDDRTAQCSAQADGYMRWYWTNYVVESGPDSFTTAFDDPAGNGNQPPYTRPNVGEPSYPVAIDPLAFYATWNPPTQQSWVANASVPRRNLGSIPASFLGALRVSSQGDGFGFAPNQNGQPLNPATNTIDREYRYNWLWVLQRPNSSDKNTATMTVVVFDKRPYQYVPPNAEYAYTGVTLTPTQTSLSVPAVNGVVLQKGSWVMDATSSGALRQAYFYRVVSATANGANIDLELQTPIRRIDGSTAAYSGTLIVLAGVSEVFERPPLTGTTP